jgi:thiol:disulfide interchange protein
MRKHRRGAVQLGSLVFLGLVAVGTGGLLFLRDGGLGGHAEPAAVHDLFAASPTFADAAASAAQQGRPVLVLATADWCPPCQKLKATTLADVEVIEAINAATVPYKLDVTNAAALSPEDAALAQRLGVSGIPALYLVDGDEVHAKRVGYVGKPGVMDLVRSPR